MVEPRFKKADKRLKASFQRIYNEGTEHVPARIIQAHIVSQEIQFKAKHHNVAGLQLCDMLAHPSAREMRFARDGAPEPDDFGKKISDILLKKKYSRDPNTEKIDGWGRKWLP